MMFDCEDETLISRLMKRAASSGRADDNEETIKKRLALFHEKTMPVIEYYNKKAMRVRYFFMLCNRLNSSNSNYIIDQSLIATEFQYSQKSRKHSEAKT